MLKALLVSFLGAVVLGCTTWKQYIPAAAPLCRIFWEDDVCDKVDEVSDVIEKTREEESDEETEL